MGWYFFFFFSFDFVGLILKLCEFQAEFSHCGLDYCNPSGDRSPNGDHVDFSTTTLRTKEVVVQNCSKLISLPQEILVLQDRVSLPIANFIVYSLKKKKNEKRLFFQ